MSTVFHLVRHASHDVISTTLTGRTPGIHISETGKIEARRLAAHFSPMPIMGIISSPRERAQETAEPIASLLHLPLKTSSALDEIDMGRWEGQDFSELAAAPFWNQWNVALSVTRPPGGETLLEVQARVVDEVMALRNAWPGQRFILVSHAETIRAMLLYTLGLHLDAWARIEIAPASISTIAIDDWGARLVSLIEAPCLPEMAT